MTVRFSDAWSIHGFQALVLENHLLRVTVVPELGGKVWSIVSKTHDREMLWHHPRMALRPAHYDATYDNWFMGGWDEIFPNDYPVVVEGEPYPDHGEIWSLPAAWHLLEGGSGTISIALEHRGIAIDTRFSKTLTLREGEPNLHVHYAITNESPKPLVAHWKLHPALPVARGARLHLPVRNVVVDQDFQDAFRQTTWAWPNAPMADGTVRDMRSLPDPDSGDVYFFYGVDLADGYCAVSYPEEQVGFGLRFDPAVLTSVWVFATFGGWRNLSTIILEPCTGYHARLDQAIAQDTAATIEKRGTISTEVVMSVLDGDDAVAAFETQGSHS